MQKRLFFILFSLVVLISYAQKTKTVYLDSSDSTRNHYTVFYPPTLPWKGYMVLLPGFGETSEDVMLETDLAKIATNNGLLVIVPVLQDGVLSFGIDSTSQNQLSTIIEDVRSKYKVQDLYFYIGGFSIGGSTALKYAEEAVSKPAAVFAIDSPLDFERFYNSSVREIRLSGQAEASEESLYMIDRIERELGGTPQNNIANYYATSPYSFSDVSQVAARKLVNIPLRLYIEPDVNWWIKERGEDFSSMNALDCSALVNELNRLGNNKAELVVTANKGYRKKTKTRNPHSWSIVDNDALIAWLLKSK